MSRENDKQSKKHKRLESSLEQKRQGSYQSRILKRRAWTIEEKQAILEETRAIGRTMSSVSRDYGLRVSQIFFWRSEEEKRLLAEAQKKVLLGRRVMNKLMSLVRSLKGVLTIGLLNDDPEARGCTHCREFLGRRGFCKPLDPLFQE